MEKILILLRQELIDLKGWFSNLLNQQKEFKKTIDDLSRTITEQKPPIVNVAAPIVKVPDIIIPEIKIPDIKIPEQKEIKIPKIEIPKIIVPDVKIPEIKIPEIKIPKIIVPKPEVTVNVPPIKIPDLQWPKEKMPIEGWVQLMGVSLQNPLPVQIRDANGKPVDFAGNITQITGGGGKADFFTIKGFSQSAFADYLNADGRLKVSFENGGVGLTDVELRATHLDVQQVSGAIDSVYVTGFGASVAASLTDSSGVQYSGSNPLPISALPTGTNAIGKVGHDITGIGHGVKTITTAGTDEALAGSTACKRVIIQSQTDNTGLIAVGTLGVDATEATGTGIILYAGDAFELEIDNLADIYIDATVSGEGVRYTYFT